MPRRPAGRGRDGGRAANRPRPRHLYLVTEDWSEGYSIRKVDLAADCGAGADTDEQQEPRRLPPAVFRLESPHNGPGHFAAAFGTKILAMHQTPRQYIPVFDVRTRCLSFGPRVQRIPVSPICVPLGDNLFRLDVFRFEILCPPPPPPEHELLWCDDLPEWSWRRLQVPPFRHQYVTSHAVHPDGRTVFVSVRVEGRDTDNTFTFDTGTDNTIWTCHRGWQLPFKGPAYSTRSWTPGSGSPATRPPPDTSAPVECRPMATTAAGSPRHGSSAGRSCFRQDYPPGETHTGATGATLVYLGMGYKSRFCLVECRSRRVGSRRHLLELTTFSPKYHKNGDLGTTRRRRVQSFKLTKPRIKNSGFLEHPVAFWL